MATAGNFSALTVLWESNAGGVKMRGISALGPASYATNGSELDLSSDSTDGLGNAYDAFSEVYTVLLSGVASGVVASSKYRAAFVPGTSGAAATGKVKLHDITAASGAEVTNTTDLSGTTFYFVVMGR